MMQTYAMFGAGFAKNLILFVMMATLVLGASGQRTNIKECGGCTFWLEGTPSINATLSKTGSCAQTCTGDRWKDLGYKGIVNIANGTFHDMQKLVELRG